MAPSKSTKILAGGLLASLAVNIGLVAYLANSGGLRRILLKLDLVEMPHALAPFQVAEVERFRLLPNTPGEIVFAGDSQIGRGPWSEFYSPIRNRGIGAERTDDLLHRLDEILESKPARIFLLVGSNDLSSAVPPVQLVRHYATILDRIAEESPTTATVVCGLLPVNRQFKDPPVYTNADVRAVNGQLKALAARYPTARFVDVTPDLVDDRGDLRAELTWDGLHLNVPGYLAIKDRVRAALELPESAPMIAPTTRPASLRSP